MSGHQKEKVHVLSRIVLYSAVSMALLALVFGAISLSGQAKASRALSGIKFNHKYHAEDVGVSCDSCHQLNSSSPRFMGFPNHDSCSACHADELDPTSAKKNCELCHTLPDYRTQLRKDRVLSPLVRFDHQQHQKSGVDCVQCHAVFDKDVLTGDEMLPTMDTCVKCHADQKIKGGTDCDFCHVKGLEKIKPKTHTAGWTTSHGIGLTKEVINSNCRV